MRQGCSRHIAFMIALAAWLGTCAAVAQTTPSVASIASHGLGSSVPACASCHGTGGGGQAAAGFPRLAGLNAAYLKRQLDSFAAGTRQSPIMQPIAKALTESERQALATYFSKLPLPPAVVLAASTSTAAAADDKLGEELATHGRWSQQVPGCEKCHGPGGIGVGEDFPPLAGQPAQYLAGQLRAFQSGTRKDNWLGLMHPIASALTERDIQAVSEWFAAQPAQTKGGKPSAFGQTPPTHAAVPAAGTQLAPAKRSTSGVALFEPPPRSAIPDTPFGAMVRQGERIFEHTGKYAGKYVGDDLNCSSCHLDAGRLAGSAPMWAAWVRYPRYRSKNGKVNTFAERLQECFRFSMNGKNVPSVDSNIIKALEVYSYWLATGAPTGRNLPGYGFPKLDAPPQSPTYANGERVYADKCAACHGPDGQGQVAGGVQVFPPLWGPRSFNWGAGMSSVETAAAFIKANMPFSRGGTLTDQQAWDVAYFLDAHERPQDPRFTGNVAATRKKYHDSRWSLYGTMMNGHLLGAAPSKK